MFVLVVSSDLLTVSNLSVLSLGDVITASTNDFLLRSELVEWVDLDDAIDFTESASVSVAERCKSNWSFSKDLVCGLSFFFSFLLVTNKGVGLCVS